MDRFFIPTFTGYELLDRADNEGKVLVEVKGLPPFYITVDNIAKLKKEESLKLFHANRQKGGF
jgi:hypothetical protein